ncbi:putative T7SS-secreted protein [Kitasatospora sp. NPDC056181]|uniref:putative T7SS-secreted protein n=1 Tax=Kitasatospora sp. NPDC056181 TaxID=3345737 RepID=UPI0035DA0C3D
MGLHFSITDLVDATDAVVDSAQKAGGKVVQKGSHLVGGALDEAGLHGAAQKVNGWGDDVADSTGLKVGERGLDQSDDPKELVHGDAKKLGEVAGHLKKFHDAFEKTGTGLARLDHEHWTGAAAEAFQKAFDPQPKQWLTAADACGKAAAALEAYAHTVTWAQGEAAEAARLWKEAKKKADAAAKAWREDAMTYNLRVKAYNSTPADHRPAAPPTDPGEFKNPAEADFGHAEEKLDAARTQRDSAARTAAGAIGAAVASAPAMPSKMQILKADVKDGLMAAPVAYEHFYGGLIKSGTDMAKLGRSLNPMDPYNLSHPAQYLDGLSTTTAGLIKAGDHPVDLLKGLVGSGWGNDPSEASGKLVGNFLIGAGTGGGGTAATLAEREAAAVAENAAKKAAQEATEKAAKDAAEKTAKEAASAAAPPQVVKALKGFLPDGYDPAAAALRDSQLVEVRAAERNLTGAARHFFDDIDAKEFGAKTWNDVAERLPAEQKDAVAKYTWGSDGEINGALRGTGPSTPEANRLIPQLDKALEAQRVPEDVIVGRGTDLGHLGFENPMDLRGHRFTEDGFMSTAIGELPSSFAGKQGVLHLVVPEGTPGLWVEKVGRAGNSERELLLGRGLTWQVDRVIQVGSQYHVFGRVLG